MTSSSVVWYAEASLHDVSFARLGRQGDHLIAEWFGIGRLIVDRAGTCATFSPTQGADSIHCAKIEAGVAQLLVRSLGGQLGFHGAAIAYRKLAFVFLGDAGAGKSTLAAAFSERREALLLADDAVALEDGCFVAPLERAHFLDDAAANALKLSPGAARARNGKVPIATRRPAVASVPLGAVVHLRFDDAIDAPILRRIGVMDALSLVIPQTVRFVVDEPECQRLEMESLMKLVASVSFYDLVRPRGFERLDATLFCLESVFSDHSP